MMLIAKITLLFLWFAEISRQEEPIVVETPLQELTFITGFPAQLACNPMQEFSYYGELASFGEGEEEPDFPEEVDEVECIITRNEEVIYNQTIIWEDSSASGFFGDASDEWKDSVAFVNLAWGTNKTSSTGFYVNLIPRDEDVCAARDTHDITTIIGRTQTLGCEPDVYIMFTEEQKNSISVSWWRGCERIERNDSNFKYEKNEDETMFDSLKIENASLHIHPGEYLCVIEKETENGRIRHVHAASKICLQRQYDFNNEPTIKPSSEEYFVAPGEDLTIIATGNTGISPDMLTLSVALQKQQTSGEWEEVCEAYTGLSKELNCTLRVHVNEKYCSIPTDEGIEALEEKKLDDNFTAIFYIRKATKARDEGTYRLRLRTTKKIPSAIITVKVQNPPGTPKWLVITLSLVGVLVVIAMVVLILLYVYSIEVHYFVKKLFGVEVQATKPMCYLLYYPDATDSDDDPVDQVRRFIAGRRFFDDNNVNGAPELNAAGHLLADHRIHMLRQCMSLVIFVTPAMLNDNDIEIFVAWQGFEDNIQNELPIVFITTPETRNLFKYRSNEENATVVTFREFMRRRKNKVIHWDPRQPNRFRRALYAFLPKVAYPGVQQQENRV